jgi:quercetin dioxygenase-like cupin family protein
MKNLKQNRLKGVLFVAAMVFLAPATWAQDPVKEDPAHYKVELENEDVRVLRINYKPGEQSVMHEHPKGVVVFLTDSKVDFTLPGNENRSMQAKSGEVIWINEDKHLPKNTGNQPMEAIQIEFKSSGSEAAAKNEGRYTTSSPLIELAKENIEAYENKNWERWKSQYASDSQIFHNNWEESITPDQFLESHSDFLKHFSSFEFVDEPVFYEQVIDDKDQKWVYFWGVWEGKMTSTGENLRIPVHLALLYKNKKIVEEYGFYDMSPYWKAMQKKD